MQDATRGVAAVVVCLVGLSAAVAGVTGAPTASVGPADTQGTNARQDSGQQSGGQQAPRPGAAVQEAVDPDVVVMRAVVAEDGTATWSIAYRTRLDDENTTAAFESLRDDIEANPSTFTERFGTGMRRTVRSAENRTGREMALRNLTVEATREQFGQEYGVVTYRFTWTAFAAVDGDRLRIGDALSGLFLDSETSLVVAYPDGYAVESVTPRPTENRTNEVVWRGQLDFGPDRPRLVVAPAGGSGPNPVVLAGTAVGLLLILAGGYLVISRVHGAGEAADETAAGGAGSGAAAAGATGEPPEELLSNEERVLRLLEDSGGRIKQQRITEEFDWTDAKTSQVVGNLRDEDEVETFRIGRENVVTLPEESDL